MGGRKTESWWAGAVRLGKVTPEYAAEQLIRHRLLNNEAPWQQDDPAEVSAVPAASAAAGGCAAGEGCCQKSDGDQQGACSHAGTQRSSSFSVYHSPHALRLARLARGVDWADGRAHTPSRVPQR